MRPLTAAELLRVWELGLPRPPAERALALLAAAGAGPSVDELARLPLGRRDTRLLALRAAMFGPRYQAVAACPSCGERLELSFAAEDVRPAPSADAVPPTLRAGDYTLETRPVDSTDFAAAAACPDVATARATLARRCIVAALRGDGPVAPDALPDEVVSALAAHLEAADPDAEITLEVACASCGTRWDALLDVAAYLWTEVETEALRLLREVHELARGYRWSEADILAMSPLRRRAYLELVHA